MRWLPPSEQYRSHQSAGTPSSVHVCLHRHVRHYRSTIAFHPCLPPNVRQRPMASWAYYMCNGLERSARAPSRGPVGKCLVQFARNFFGERILSHCCVCGQRGHLIKAQKYPAAGTCNENICLAGHSSRSLPGGIDDHYTSYTKLLKVSTHVG